MPHDMPLVTTIATGLAIALVLGLLAQKLKLSPIVGYLLAGIVVGPHTPGPVADPAIALELAEIGVALLMFGTGLHFNLGDLMAVRAIAIPGAVVQSAVATALGLLVGWLAGWDLGTGLVFGLGLSVASTVVLIRGLEAQNQLATPAGHIAVGWLIVEDIFTVLALVLLPALTLATTGGDGGVWQVAGCAALALGKIGLLAAVLLLAGSRVVPWLLARVARTRSRELFTLTVMVLAIGIAVVSAKAFGASMALGAFLAGMVVNQSHVSHQAAADALPMRDAFAVLFFVSVGMLFDPALLVERPLLVAGALAVVLVGKPLAAVVIVVWLRRTMRTALIVAAGLAQIGEFSFILASAAIALNATAGRQVFDPDIMGVLVACAILTIPLNPLLFASVPKVEALLRRRRHLRWLLRKRAATQPDAQPAPATAGAVRAVVVGYGPVGRTVTRLLRDFGIEPVVVELNVDTVLELNTEGTRAVFGDASRRDILHAAGIEQARYLVVTLPDAALAMPVVITAKEMAPDLRVIARARFLRDAPLLADVGADMVGVEEVESAVSLAALLLREVGADGARVEAEVQRIRGDQVGAGRTQSAPAPS